MKLVSFTLVLFCLTMSVLSQNIILVMSDDQGYGDIAVHGNPVVRTPHLDKLYTVSIRCTNFHVDPICAPTRAALMTGRYARRVGVRGTYAALNYLHPGEKTMGEIFRSMGYRTALFGKWHLGGNYPLRPIDRGFEEWVGHGDGGNGTTNDYWNNVKWNDHYLHNGQWKPYEGFMTDVFFQEAMRYIDNGDKRPFFVCIPTNVPHQSWNTPEAWTRPYTSQGESLMNALFYASVERVDHNMGRLRQFLTQKGLADNTILIFMTDNGTANRSTYNAGMRGRKGSVYEGGHRVPCFFHWPARWGEKGRDISMVTAHIDILPTLINLCGVSPSVPLPEFDGTDLTPLLDGTDSPWPHRYVVVDQQQSRIKASTKAPHVVMSDKWRLVNGTELYDITVDAGQKNNLAQANPSVVKRMNTAFNQWWGEVSVNASVLDPVIAGSGHQDTLFLTGLDWLIGGQTTWAQGYVRMGQIANGEHFIQIASPGVYAFALRRWPKESGLALRDSTPALSIPGYLLVDKYNGQSNRGISLPITGAKISINGHEQMFDAITDTTREVVFEAFLEEGPVRFQTWFEVAGMDNPGAYYVYIYRNDPFDKIRK